ncbi:MAG: oleate hydratase [Sphaerochaetaceae bacterium]|nr:oleate hydratase [Sphaerochaetaceae bacterium]
MFYSKGNFEAFSTPEKPKDVEKKSAYIVGAGLASLSAACFLIRDGQMNGSNIHIFEEMDIAGGACDGIHNSEKGFVIRGGREMEEHFECLWDLFRSIPSLETEGISVLDEFNRLNKKDPNFSLMRATVNRGEDAKTNNKFGLSEKGSKELMNLFFTPEEELDGKDIEDYLSDEFFNSNFWLYWRTMFAFEQWHSAIEMKRYIQRFIHHIGGLPDFTALKFTKYNQYESLIMPLLSYLEKHDVDFQYNATVSNVIVENINGEKVAKEFIYTQNNEDKKISLTSDDLVFVTNGSCTENASLGDQNTAPKFDSSIKGCWKLWENIASQDPEFGNPKVFCSDTEKSNWESCTVTTLDNKIPPYIEKVCKRDPFSGKVVTGGIISCKDSSWLMSYTLNRQPHFSKQPKDQLVVWVYGLFTDVPGDYIKKPMRECTGVEITQEWLYHLGVPIDQIDDMAKNSANSVPCMMPYITAFFMPRKAGDRPLVVPNNCKNLAFIGQFAETPRDTVFTTEYSVRTAMEAVYTLLDVDRGVPEVFGSLYDLRVLLDSSVKMLDGESPLKTLDLNLKQKMALKKVMARIQGSDIEKLLKEYKVI